jgi:hypothetical protein
MGKTLDIENYCVYLALSIWFQGFMAEYEVRFDGIMILLASFWGRHLTIYVTSLFTGRLRGLNLTSGFFVSGVLREFQEKILTFSSSSRLKALLVSV